MATIDPQELSPANQRGRETTPGLDDQTRVQINYAAYNKSNSMSLWAISGIVCLYVALLGIFGYKLRSGNGAIFAVVISTAIVFSLAAIYALKDRGRQRQQLQQFVTDNNFSLNPAIGQQDIATSLLQVGTKIAPAIDSFKGKYQKLSFKAYRYEIEQSRDDTLSYCVMHVVLPKQFPLLILDSTVNKKDAFTRSDLPQLLPNTHELSLEGDFNKHYRVIIENGTEQTVLEFLTPDIMSDLLTVSRVDFEIEADNLYLIVPATEYSKQVMSLLFGALKIINNHLSVIDRSWQTSSSQTSIASMTEQAEAPRRYLMARRFDLKRSAIPFIIGALWFAIIWAILAFASKRM